jgi:uncharacterized membrane protein
MSNGVIVLIGAFEDEKTAKNAYQSLRKKLVKAKEQQTFTESYQFDPDMVLQNVAVVSRSSKGKLKVKESGDMAGGKGALIGGVMGGILGLMTGPVGWVAIGGAAIGGLLAKKSDPGISNSSLEKLGKGLEKGQAAIVAVVDEAYAEQFTDMFKQMGAQTTLESLDESTVERLRAASA